MKQVLTVPNPLGMYDGCYAKQRNGEVVGPWVWSPDRCVWVTEGKSCCIARRSNGRIWAGDADESSADLIEVLPPPAKLPEPIEVWGNYYPMGDAFSEKASFHSHDNAEKAKKVGPSSSKPYRVRIEFLEEAT